MVGLHGVEEYSRKKCGESAERIARNYSLSKKVDRRARATWSF